MTFEFPALNMKGNIFKMLNKLRFLLCVSQTMTADSCVNLGENGKKNTLGVSQALFFANEQSNQG